MPHSLIYWVCRETAISARPCDLAAGRLASRHALGCHSRRATPVPIPVVIENGPVGGSDLTRSGTSIHPYIRTWACPKDHVHNPDERTSAHPGYARDLSDMPMCGCMDVWMCLSVSDPIRPPVHFRSPLE